MPHATSCTTLHSIDSTAATEPQGLTASHPCFRPADVLIGAFHNGHLAGHPLQTSWKQLASSMCLLRSVAGAGWTPQRCRCSATQPRGSHARMAHVRTGLCCSGSPRASPLRSCAVLLAWFCDASQRLPAKRRRLFEAIRHILALLPIVALVIPACAVCLRSSLRRLAAQRQLGRLWAHMACEAPAPLLLRGIGPCLVAQSLPLLLVSARAALAGALAHLRVSPRCCVRLSSRSVIMYRV